MKKKPKTNGVTLLDIYRACDGLSDHDRWQVMRFWKIVRYYKMVQLKLRGYDTRAETSIQ